MDLIGGYGNTDGSGSGSGSGSDDDAPLPTTEGGSGEGNNSGIGGLADDNSVEGSGHGEQTTYEWQCSWRRRRWRKELQFG